MPDNAGFYQAAYGMAAAIYALYALSIYWRWKRIRKKRIELIGTDQKRNFQ